LRYPKSSNLSSIISQWDNPKLSEAERDLIKWFIQLDETNLNFKNKYRMSVIDYLSNNKSDSDKVDIPNRIKLLSEFNIIN
jgi:hypothetical protein